MMKRNNGAQQSTEDERAAAERLREAQNLLAGSQQQLATGKVDSMAREAGRLTQEERTQADRINKLAQGGQQGADGVSGSSDLDNMQERLRERDRLAADRQQLSDDLSKPRRATSRRISRTWPRSCAMR